MTHPVGYGGGGGGGVDEPRRKRQDDSKPNHVLLFTIINPMYPITVQQFTVVTLRVKGQLIEPIERSLAEVATKRLACASVVLVHVNVQPFHEHCVHPFMSLQMRAFGVDLMAADDVALVDFSPPNSHFFVSVFIVVVIVSCFDRDEVCLCIKVAESLIICRANNVAVDVRIPMDSVLCDFSNSDFITIVRPEVCVVLRIFKVDIWAPAERHAF
ncbi:hypothetical protein FQA39_LY16602 [Lamprigera yunnana]|nr:hypothetical protein FQA39_LY16602 [Lamprigera yunnana]